MARSKNGRLFSRTEFVEHKPSPELLMWKSVVALAAADATKSIKNRPTYTSWTDNDIDRKTFVHIVWVMVIEGFGKINTRKKR